MDGVFFDGYAVKPAKRPFFGGGGVGVAHQPAVFLNCVFAGQHLDDDRSGSDVFDQFVEKGLVLVDGVKTGRLFARQPQHFLRDDLQAAFFYCGDDFSA